MLEETIAGNFNDDTSFSKQSLKGAIKFLEHCQSKTVSFFDDNPLDDLLEWLETMDTRHGDHNVTIVQNVWQPALTSVLLHRKVFGILGVPLENLPRNQDNFPWALETAFKYVEVHGNVKKIYLDLKRPKNYERSDKVLLKLSLGQSITENVHSVTTAIKQILLSLPEPLMGDEMVPFWETFSKFEDKDDRIQILRREVFRLRPMNRIVLQRFIYHLKHFTEVSEADVTAHEFAIYLSKILMTASDVIDETKLDSSRRKIFQEMIENADEIFLEKLVSTNDEDDYLPTDDEEYFTADEEDNLLDDDF